MIIAEFINCMIQNGLYVFDLIIKSDEPGDNILFGFGGVIFDTEPSESDLYNRANQIAQMAGIEQITKIIT